MTTGMRVTFFCGSRVGTNPAYVACARDAGRLSAERGIVVVYGGGSIGLMGALADACLAHGGRVSGVIPTDLFAREVVHTGLTELHPVQSMHERKALMTSSCDAFVVLPGGFGTLDEMFEALTWRQIGVHQKPLAVVNTEGFFNGLLSFIETARAHGFVPDAETSPLVVEPTVDRALDRLQALVAR